MPSAHWVCTAGKGGVSIHVQVRFLCRVLTGCALQERVASLCTGQIPMPNVHWVGIAGKGGVPIMYRSDSYAECSLGVHCRKGWRPYTCTCIVQVRWSLCRMFTGWALQERVASLYMYMYRSDPYAECSLGVHCRKGPSRDLHPIQKCYIWDHNFTRYIGVILPSCCTWHSIQLSHWLMSRL